MLAKVFVIQEAFINKGMCIQIGNGEARDKVMKYPDKSGFFFVKHTKNYFKVSVDCGSQKVWQLLWKLKLHERYKVLMWRIYSFQFFSS